jgi:hypothetical protein
VKTKTKDLVRYAHKPRIASFPRRTRTLNIIGFVLPAATGIDSLVKFTMRT